MIRSLILSLLFAATASAAITERYVTSAGAGAADGTSEANAMSYATFKDYMETAGSFTAAAGDRFNLKGSFTIGATDSWVNGGSATSPVIVRGYASSITDGYQGRTNDNGALVTTNFATLTYSSTFRLNNTGAFWVILENLNIIGTVSNPVVSFPADCAIVRCRIENSSTNTASAGVNLASRNVLFDSDVVLTGASGGATGYAVNAGGASCRTVGCRIKVTNTAPAIIAVSSALVAKNTIFGSGGIGITMNSTTGAPHLLDNTIVGCTGDGIDVITGTTVLQFIAGNMITDQTGVGIDMVSAANAGFMAYNRLRDNSASINSGTDWVAATSYGHQDTGTTGTTATDYVDYAGNDFRLVPTSPATSANLPAKGSIGALQRDQTSSGGASAHTFVQ